MLIIIITGAVTTEFASNVSIASILLPIVDSIVKFINDFVNMYFQNLIVINLIGSRIKN